MRTAGGTGQLHPDDMNVGGSESEAPSRRRRIVDGGDGGERDDDDGLRLEMAICDAERDGELL